MGRSARQAPDRGAPPGRVPSRSFRSTSSSMASTWCRRSRCTVGSSRSEHGRRPARRPAPAGPAAVRRGRARAHRDLAGRRDPPAGSRPRSRPGRRAERPASAASWGNRPRRHDLLDAGSRTAGSACRGTTARRRAMGPARESLDRHVVEQRPARGGAEGCPASDPGSVDLPAPLGPPAPPVRPARSARATSRRAGRSR